MFYMSFFSPAHLSFFLSPHHAACVACSNRLSMICFLYIGPTPNKEAFRGLHNFLFPPPPKKKLHSVFTAKIEGVCFCTSHKPELHPNACGMKAQITTNFATLPHTSQRNITKLFKLQNYNFHGKSSQFQRFLQTI